MIKEQKKVGKFYRTELYPGNREKPVILRCLAIDWSSCGDSEPDIPRALFSFGTGEYWFTNTQFEPAKVGIDRRIMAFFLERPVKNWRAEK